MRDFWKPAVTVILFLAIGIVVVNDLGGAAWNHLRADEYAQRVSEEAIRVYQSSGNETAAGLAAVEAGKRLGVEVYGFEVATNRLTVWVKVKPRRTLVLWRFPQYVDKLEAKAQFSDIIK